MRRLMLCVLVGCACRSSMPLPTEDRALYQAYAPKVIALAEAAASRCAELEPYAPGPGQPRPEKDERPPNPAAGGGLVEDERVLLVHIDCFFRHPLKPEGMMMTGAGFPKVKGERKQVGGTPTWTNFDRLAKGEDTFEQLRSPSQASGQPNAIDILAMRPTAKGRVEVTVSIAR